MRTASSQAKMSSAPSESTVSKVEQFRSILEDEEFFRLRSVFLATGKGRRPKLPSVKLTRGLAIRLLLLKKDGGKSYDETACFFGQLFPDAEIGQLRYILSKTDQDVKQLSDNISRESFAAEALHLEVIGPFMRKADPTSKDLIGGKHACSYVSPSRGLLKDLTGLRQREGGTFKDMCQWWEQLTGRTIDERTMYQVQRNVMKKALKLASSAHRPKGQEEYQQFLTSDAFPVSSFSSAESSASNIFASASTSSDSTELETQPSPLVRKLAAGPVQLAASQRRVEELLQELSVVKHKLSIMEETSRSYFSEMQTLAAEKANADAMADKFSCELLKAQQKCIESSGALQEAERRLQYYKKQGHLKKLKRREETIKQRDIQLQTAARHVCKQQKHNKITSQKLRALQLSHAGLKRRLALVQRRYRRELEQKAPKAEVIVEPDTPVLRLKDENGHFTTEAKICVMALVVEQEIPAHRCGTIIQTVARHLFGARVPDSDLPSQRSALRFADLGHVVSKSHVADVLANSDHWDLHTDGTSRSGKKYVGQQVTTQDGSFSMGFTAVASEDTTTLVDISIQMVEELADLYPQGQAQENFIGMLRGLSAVMTDRASVMKSFGRTLEAQRQQLLQTDEGLEFLHCNAHFLLGLGTQCKKALANDEKEKGLRLGRDGQPGFHTYKTSESSAYRYIWMACDCLGPRGDDKNGCRDSWEAYCLMVERPSTVTSFRENRFNNLFQAAASLHYHQHDIRECLRSYLPRRNKKIDSVLADCEDEVIDCHLITLGLLYFRVTGPYWCLLGGSVHYLDFYLHVEKLHQLLLEWQSDASPALQANFQPLFPGVMFPTNEQVLQSLLALEEEKKAAVKALLETVCKSLLEVTQRQLADFLPGGRYFNNTDENLRSRLSHSRITNLVSEECFADLDFSLFKRWSASLHHHSTVNLLKRNKSVSMWLCQKTPAEQGELLKFSAKKAPLLREKYLRMEKDTVKRRCDLLQEVQLQKQATEERRQQQKLAVMADLRPHQGPCTSPADIMQMLEVYTTSKHLKKALRAEILFQKLMLNKKSPLLTVTGTNVKLTNQLLQFFGGEILERLPPLQPSEQGASVNKRPHLEQCASDSESDSSELTTDSAEDEEAPFNFQQFQYSFTQVGEIVAVYYVEDFYIGEVTSVLNDSEGIINFMEKARTSAKGCCMYRWPCPPDSCTISSAVVFASHLSIAPSSSSGRSFVVEEPEDLPGRYQALRHFLASLSASES